MVRFGSQWVSHADTIRQHWLERVTDDDIVLVPGDISWAMRLDGARPDLQFLSELPGRKVMVKGNHDYWWNSVNKVRKALPDGMTALQADAVRMDDVIFAGTRMWDVPGVRLGDIINWAPNSNAAISAADTMADETESRKVYDRELGRLERALEHLGRLQDEQPAALKVLLLHYPPSDAALHPTAVTERIEKAGVDHVVFGHLHAVKQDVPAFGEARGVNYHLASCDYINFKPILIAEL